MILVLCGRNDTVAAVFLQVNTTYCNVGTSLVAAKIEHKFHVIHVNSRHIAFVEHVRFVCFQLNNICKIEHVIIVILYQFHRYVVMILRRKELRREVVVGR